MVKGHNLNVGDRVLVEAVVDRVDKDPDTAFPYRLIIDNYEDWFDESVIKCKCDDQKTYEQGMQDLCDALNYVMEMPWQEIDKLWGVSLLSDLILSITPADIVSKVNTWKEEQNAIKQGDIVDLDYIDEHVTRSIRGVYFSTSYDYYWILVEGEPAPMKLLQDEWTIRKVKDKHVDIFGERGLKDGKRS